MIDPTQDTLERYTIFLEENTRGLNANFHAQESPFNSSFYFKEIPIVHGATFFFLFFSRSAAGMYMGWSLTDCLGSGRHNYFSLIFRPDFIEERSAAPARNTCRIPVPPVSGYVFTRCLGGGSRGSGGKGLINR